MMYIYLITIDSGKITLHMCHLASQNSVNHTDVWQKNRNKRQASNMVIIFNMFYLYALNLQGNSNNILLNFLLLLFKCMCAEEYSNVLGRIVRRMKKKLS